MAIAFDAYSNIASERSTTPFGYDHTPVGTPKGVFVWLIQPDSSSPIANVAVTYGGVSMTEVALSPLVESDEGAVVYGFFLGASIPTGTQAIEVTGDGGQVQFVYCITVTAAGDTEVADTSTVDVIDTTGEGTLSLGGSTCFCAQAHYSGLSSLGFTPSTGWTELSEIDSGVDGYGLAYYGTVGSTDVTFGGSLSSSDDIAVLGIAIKEATGGGATVSPTQGALTITGHAPTVTSPISITPSVGALVLTGLAPVANLTHSANTGVGELSITGQAPDITVTAGQAITTDVGVLTLAGLAPVVNLTHSANTGTGELTITGLAPDVTTTVAGTVNTGIGALAIAGHAPTIVVSLSVTTDVGALNITGYEPTLQITGPIAISTEFGALYLTGHEPAVTNSGDVTEEQPETIGGKPEKRTYKKKAKLPFYDSEQEYESRVQVDEVQVEKPAKKAKVVPISDKASQKESAKIAEAPLLGDLVQGVQIAPIEVKAIEVTEEDEALIENIVVSLLLAA